ncbi:MAG: hypothetical protein WD534_05005 [Phycisphaeraceae bacterium]
MHQQNTRLTPHFVKSLLVHALLLALIFMVGQSQTEQVQEQQRQAMDRMREQRESAAEQAQQEEEQLTREMLKDELKEQMAELFEEELEEEDEQALREEVDEAVDEVVDERLEDEQLTQMTPEETFELRQDLQEQVFERLRDALASLQERQVLGEVERFVRQDVAPAYREQIEHELYHDAGWEIANALADAVREQRSGRLGEVREALEAAAKELDRLREQQFEIRDEMQEADVADRQQATREREAELAREIEQTLADAAEASPRLGEPVEATRDRLAELDAQAPMQQAEDALRDGQREQAGESLEHAADRLGERAEQVRHLADQVNDAGDSDDYDGADRALARAAMPAVREAVEGSVGERTREQAASRVADRVMDHIGERLERIGANEGAMRDQVRGRVSEALQDAMAGHAAPDTEPALRESQDEFGEADAQAAGELAEMLGSGEAAQQTVARTSEAVSPRASSRAGRAVERAAEFDFEADNLAGDSASRMARMDILSDKLNQVASNLQAGRGLTPNPNAQGPAQDFRLGMGSGPRSAMTGEGNPPGDTAGMGQSPLSRQGGMTGGPDTGGPMGTVNRSGTLMGSADTGAPPTGLNREGTMQGGMDTGGTPDGSPPSDEPPGIGDSKAARYGYGYNDYAAANREVYEQLQAYRDALRAGEGQSESNVFEDIDQVGGGASFVRPTRGPRPALAYLDGEGQLRSQQQSNTDNRNRQLPEPTQEGLVFGAAEYQHQPVTIDGDLSDWGDLRHAMTMRWNPYDERIDDGIPLWMRWSPEGLYFAYRVEGRTEVEPPENRPYEGDLLEVFIDVDNLRRESMDDSPYAQQLTLMPFGFGGDPEATFSEIGRGFRDIPPHDYRLDTTGEYGQAAGRIDDSGYTVEGFISIDALAKPRLPIGQTIAMNFSVNLGFDYALSQQWSLSKSQETYNKPITWGDVLLLGSDAEARFVSAENLRDDAGTITVGDAVGVEIDDPDMNVHTDQVDMIAVEVYPRSEPAARRRMNLMETGRNTGVFRGSFRTQLVDTPKQPNTLNAEPGDTLILEYEDRRTAYGERDRVIQAMHSLAQPVFRSGGD